MFQIKRRLHKAAIEISLYPASLSKSDGLRLAVLPTNAREYSSLLRAYNIASELRKIGWQTIVLHPKMGFNQRTRILRLFKPDLVLVQGVRHHLNRATLLEQWPIVYDIDDAHFLLPDLAPEVMMLCSSARGVICGSRYIEDWVGQYNSRTNIIWTGTEITQTQAPDHADRPPIVTWAQLFPERDYHRAELNFIADVMVKVSQRRGGVDLRLYSWSGTRDVPALERMLNAGVDIEFMPKLDYGNFMMSLQDSAVGLAAITGETGYAQGKSFGKILGYLDAKVPVVCSDAGEHGRFFRPESGVVSNDPDVWVDAIDVLLDDPERRTKMSEAAHADFVQYLSLESAARQVDAFLRSLLHEIETQKSA